MQCPVLDIPTDARTTVAEVSKERYWRWYQAQSVDILGYFTELTALGQDYFENESADPAARATVDVAKEYETQAFGIQYSSGEKNLISWNGFFTGQVVTVIEDGVEKDKVKIGRYFHYSKLGKGEAYCFWAVLGFVAENGKKSFFCEPIGKRYPI